MPSNPAIQTMEVGGVGPHRAGCLSNESNTCARPDSGLPIRSTLVWLRLFCSSLEELTQSFNANFWVFPQCMLLNVQRGRSSRSARRWRLRHLASLILERRFFPNQHKSKRYVLESSQHYGRLLEGSFCSCLSAGTSICYN